MENNTKEELLNAEMEKIIKEQEAQEKREELSTLKIFKFQLPGDKISGILLELTTVPTQYSDTSPFAKIKTENDGINGIFLPYELKQVLTPELIGDKVEIEFKQWQNTKSGRKMKKFSVFRIKKNKELQQSVSNDVSNGVGTLLDIYSFEKSGYKELLEMENMWKKYISNKKIENSTE